MLKSATLSPCETFRWTLTRKWDDRPMLLVCMFNPSDADHLINDPTVTLVCHIANNNGYGGIVVVNGNPLRSSKPEPALQMFEWDKASDWSARDVLQENLGVIVSEVKRAGAVLLAWGALAYKTNSSADWFDNVREEIESELPVGSQIYCLGKTKDGYPKHPMALGKYKVPKNAPLIPWRA
jgi:hypothetical protein